MSALQLSFLNSEVIASSHSRCNFFYPSGVSKAFSLQASCITSQRSKEHTVLANLLKGLWLCFGDSGFAAGETWGMFQTPQNMLLVSRKPFLCWFSSAFLFCLETFLTLNWWGCCILHVWGESEAYLVSS